MKLGFQQLTVYQGEIARIIHQLPEFQRWPPGLIPLVVSFCSGHSLYCISITKPFVTHELLTDGKWRPMHKPSFFGMNKMLPINMTPHWINGELYIHTTHGYRGFHYYNQLENKWDRLTSLHFSLSNSKLIAHDYDSCIYIINLGDQSNHWFQERLKYNSKSNCLSPWTSNQTAALDSCHSFFSHQHFIYALGGNSNYRYNSISSYWENIPSPSLSLRNPGIVALQEHKIAIMGGFKVNSITKTKHYWHGSDVELTSSASLETDAVSIFDTLTNTWTIPSWKLPMAFSNPYIRKFGQEIYVFNRPYSYKLHSKFVLWKLDISTYTWNQILFEEGEYIVI